MLNMETYYFMSKKQIEALESCDMRYLQQTFNSRRTTVREAYYLECGKIKIRHVLAKRRLLYWHHILTREPDELIKKIYLCQKYESKNKSEWFSMIQNEKKSYKIDLSDEEVSQMSKTKFKSFINFKVNSEAYLQMVNTKKSKLEMIIKK